MKKHLIFILLLPLTSSAVNAQQLTPASAATSSNESLSAFHAINVTDGIQLYLQSGKEPGIRVDASSQNLRQKIKTVVENQVLRVYFDASEDPTWKGLVNSKEEFKVYVTASEINSLLASKGASITLENPLANGNRLSVGLSSGGRLEGNVQVEALTISLRGGSEASITGAAAKVDLQVREGSEFLSPKLNAQECVAFASSDSHVRLDVSKSLEAVSINEAVIKYSGEAVLRKERQEQGGKVTHI